MTSTNINQGLVDGSKPSSKVLQPPGGGSSDIFGTGTPAVAPPQRARPPPSNNIFGGYEEPARNNERARHDRLRSNVFGAAGETTSAPTLNSAPENTDPNNKPKSDDDEDDEDKEKEEGEESNNNDAKQETPQQETPVRKSKGDGVYNPITGELNIGQSNSPTKGVGRARGEFHVDESATCLSEGTGTPSSPGSPTVTVLTASPKSGGSGTLVTLSPGSRCRSPHPEFLSGGSLVPTSPVTVLTATDHWGYYGTPVTLSPSTRGRSLRPDTLVLGTPEEGDTGRRSPACSRRLNADVSNPITGEKKSFSIGGAGETVNNRPSTRVVQPPGGASTRLW